MGALVFHSDNCLIFQSPHFLQACVDYRLQQGFITPYAPEQNGMIERYFRSFKEECVWQNIFKIFNVHVESFVIGCTGTTRNDFIRRWSIEAQSSAGPTNELRWADFREALLCCIAKPKITSPRLSHNKMLTGT
ncbi:MAG: DDE-type integrase/transposase/recombinase [Nitrospira sp.]|nr:DDE-type integrase/transposase/recombinase [Nitrospira sp.]